MPRQSDSFINYVQLMVFVGWRKDKFKMDRGFPHKELRKRRLTVKIPGEMKMDSLGRPSGRESGRTVLAHTVGVTSDWQEVTIEARWNVYGKQKHVKHRLPSLKFFDHWLKAKEVQQSKDKKPSVHFVEDEVDLDKIQAQLTSGPAKPARYRQTFNIQCASCLKMFTVHRTITSSKSSAVLPIKCPTCARKKK